MSSHSLRAWLHKVMCALAFFNISSVLILSFFFVVLFLVFTQLPRLKRVTDIKPLAKML